jgi:spore maturation protein CgeB
VVLVGTGFPERIELLSQVDWTGIDLGLYGVWSMLPSRHRLRRFVRGSAVFNRGAVGLYLRAKIGLNLHRQSVGLEKESGRIEWAESLNPRGYELAACKVFQLSDYRAEVSELFSTSVPVFSDAQTLTGLLHRFLNDFPRRERLALDALHRIQPHNYRTRAVQLLADLERFDSGA